MVLGALLGNVLPRAASFAGPRAVLAAFNHVIGQHPNARDRLASHAGRRVLIGVDGNAPLSLPQLWIEVLPDGRLGASSAPEGGQADVQILIVPSAAAARAMVSDGLAGLKPHLRIEGDLMLAGVLDDIAREARWDYEDDLSRVIGDGAARRVGAGLDAGREGLSRLRERVSTQAAGVFRQAASRADSPAASRTDGQRLRRSIDEIASRLDRLEERLRSRG